MKKKALSLLLTFLLFAAASLPTAVFAQENAAHGT